MNIQSYLRRKKADKPKFREDRRLCRACWQPKFNCFCHAIEKFDPKMEFVILIHPKESGRRISTGRMSYLSLDNSHIIRGRYFPNHPKIKILLSEPGYKNIILSPRAGATNLTGLPEQEIRKHFPQDKKLRIFILDGTWSNVGKMFRLTPEIQELQRYFFIPDSPSNIRVRKQPNDKCYCTLEAIHHTIELLGASQGFDTTSRVHDNLLKPFNWMVEGQIKRIKDNQNWRSYGHNHTKSLRVDVK